jgi:uncharacterized protein
MQIKRSVRNSTLAAMLAMMAAPAAMSQSPGSKPNLAIVATPSVANRYGGGNLDALNDGQTPTPRGNQRGGGGGNRPMPPRTQTWVQYEWAQPVSTKEVALFWWNFNDGIRLPMAYRVSYWDGSQFVPVKNAAGFGIANNQYNSTTFDEIKTTKLRLELDSADRGLATLAEWAVYKTENSPSPAPMVVAGIDRDVAKATSPLRSNPLPPSATLPGLKFPAPALLRLAALPIRTLLHNSLHPATMC